MKTHGFTLIELLAVIVILAIIALIATPIILNIIEDTKESANIRSAELYMSSLETTIASKNMQSEFKPNQCTITNKVTTCDGVTLNVVTEETMPTSGTIKFENGKVISATIDFNGEGVVLNNGKYEEAETFTVIYENIEVLDSYPTTIVKTGDLIIDFKVNTVIKDVKVDGVSTTEYTLENNVLTLKNVQGNVEIVGLPPIGTGVTTSLAGNVPEGNFEPGDEYVIQVNDSQSFNFFVLSDNNDGTVNMILDRNILNTGALATASNKGFIAWYSSESEARLGPITAMTYLHNGTKNWEYIDNIKINYADNSTSTTYGYGKILTSENITNIYKKDNTTITASFENLKARMITREEVLNSGCKEIISCDDGERGKCPAWLVNGLASSQYYSGVKLDINIDGYWTLSASPKLKYQAIHVTSNGIATTCNGHTDFSSTAGVRPVITVKKSQLVLPTEE